MAAWNNCFMASRQELPPSHSRLDALQHGALWNALFIVSASNVLRIASAFSKTKPKNTMI
mgnify:CR=1 FL=1